MSESDEDYGPISAAWGNQAPVKVAKSEGWDSLIDHNVKVGPNDLGSGSLHRRGNNFKPINEELILAQRKNIPVPKKTMLEAIRKTELTLGLPESKEKPRKGNLKKKAGNTFSQPRPHSLATSYIPPPSTTRQPLPPANGETLSWLNTELADTPFWEKKNNDAPTINASNEQDLKRANNTDWASAVKEVTSDPQDVHEDSPTGWMISDKVDKPPLGPEKTKKAAAVTWGSNVEVDSSVTGNWGTVKAQDHPETRFTPPPQSTVKTNQWRTPAPRETPAPRLNNYKDLRSVSNDNILGATSSSADWTTFSSNSTEKWRITDQQQNRNGGVNEESAACGSTIPTTTTTTTTLTTTTTPTPTPTPTITSTITSNTNDQHIPSDKPSWLNSIPDKGSQSHSLRFSNPSKQRYSEMPIDIPEPVNYRRDGRITAPLRTAPPPPPENSLVITIKVELPNSAAVFQEIRELDDPHQLAVDFGTKNNVNKPKVIEALTKLFTKQKELELKKKNQKLQRRVQPKNYDNVYSSNNNQFSSKFSTYSRPSPAAPSRTPFVYY